MPPQSRFLQLTALFLLMAAASVSALAQFTTFTGVEILKDEAKAELRFHDPNTAWYTMGIDTSDGNKFKINGGGTVGASTQFVMTPDGRVGIGVNPASTLHVNGPASGDIAVIGSGSQYLYFQSNVSGGYGALGVYDSAAVSSRSLVLQPAGGSVGIGTAVLGEKLTVGSFSDSPNIKISRWAFFGQEASHLTTVLGGNARVLGANTVVAESTVDGYRAVRMKYNEGITFHAYVGSVTAGDIVGNERMRITPQGNIGIGTTTPTGKLTISGAADHTNGDVLITGNVAPTLFLKNNNGNLVTQIMSWDGAGNDSLAGARIGTRTRSSKSAHILFTTDDNIRMMVKDDGNVGIGTTSPSHKLTVNGTIRAKEVIVDTGWADYVFAEDYRLAPLSEVEAHIKAHKHLPDMPSAAEVAEKGVSMGEMQAKLLAKVEELTLHLIEQEKRAAAQVEAQQAQIAKLTAEVARLSSGNQK